ncbi:MAG: antibiotic biosynthesis monooxygenase [Anaerolineae bacterium]|nr:antibiotic biosynthesis monooxygenase [Anaerolineae bacterium]
MAYLLVQHHVEDYARWRKVFDEHDAMRRAHGAEEYQIFRDQDDPNHITMLFQWDSPEHARQFAESDDLREAMQHAGVTGRPVASFLEEI